MTPTAPTRPLVFATETDAAAEVHRLRQDGYRQTGDWSLPQMCRHLRLAVDRLTVPPGPDAPAASPEARALLGTYLSTGHPPPGTPSPEPLVPPAGCDAADVDGFLDALDRLRAYAGPAVQMGRFGVVPIADARRFHLAHAAHHLAHLVPVAVV